MQVFIAKKSMGNGLPRMVAESLRLKIFKTQMEMALSNLLWAGELDYRPADSLSTSITLW